MYKIVFIILSLMLLTSCRNHKTLVIEPNMNIFLKKQIMCYKLSDSISPTKKIFDKSYLNKERQSSDFYLEYNPKIILNNVVEISKRCSKEYISIRDINIFNKYLSDTAQWREVYYIEVVIDFNDKNYSLKNMGFKDYESTGWVYVFKFHKPENEIITETIQRALVRIFTDIEDAISNKLTLEQRNAKKDKDRLETEKLMDKYIKAQKELEKTFNTK